MPDLTQEQRERALKSLHSYLAAAPEASGTTPVQRGEQLNTNRRTVIHQHLSPLLSGYLAGEVALADFKSQVDGINKRHGHWGFKGIKGMMFFNLATNVASDLGELDAELKAVLIEPVSEEMAKSRLNTFLSYIRRLGEEHVEAGGHKAGRPSPGSVPFFLSYFWQVQQPEVWPVYYTNSVNTMTDLNLWRTSDDLAADYLRFKHIHEELAALFTEEVKRPFSLYDVEHVFWFEGANPYGASHPAPADRVAEPPIRSTAGWTQGLPDSYVPPLVAVLPRMARHEDALVAAAQEAGTSLERAFERYIDAALTILGYETKLLGQGQGRVPDGLALDHDNSYALLWDAKIRAEGYSIGTDDRTIREYITSQSRELKKRRTVRNIYYLIISSGFADDGDDTIRAIKMETDVNEVILVEADALVAVVDTKLRDPLQVSLGPDGIQRLFSSSGVLTSENVRQILG